MLSAFHLLKNWFISASSLPQAWFKLGSSLVQACFKPGSSLALLRLIEISSPQFSSRAWSSKILSQFRAEMGHRCNPKNLRIFFTPMTPSKNDPRPPKKKFSYIFFYHLYKKFFFSEVKDHFLKGS